MHSQLINRIRDGLVDGVVVLVALFVACSAVSLSASAELYHSAKAVIFDCDGVLVDTEYGKFLAWQSALASFQIDFSIEEYMPLVGHSSKNILAMIAKSKQIELPEKIIELKNAKYKALQKEGVQPIQPMVDFARILSEKRETSALKLGLASSAPKEEILFNLREIGLSEAFDLVISGSDDLEEYFDEKGKNKPKPYIYIEAAKRLNIAPELCLVFEDTAAGVEAAAGARMNVIAIPNQFTANQDFSKASAHFTSYEELPSPEVFQGNHRLLDK